MINIYFFLGLVGLECKPYVFEVGLLNYLPGNDY